MADIFGRRNVGTVFGWVFFAHQVGAAGASWFGGRIRDTMGSYELAFTIGGVIAITAGVVALLIARRHASTPGAAPVPA